MAQRPRQSILSLFDPLSESSDHSFSPDKENHAGETSFFFPGIQGRKPPTPLHTLRRRLIDVGDITVDEPDMQDLLAEEDELDQLHNIEDDDDGNTLTWKDMAKAATPKWSNKHATALTTPKASPTPRTPLAEISFRDDATPMARKKSYKRQIIPAASKLSQVEDIPTCTIEIQPPSPAKIPNLFSPPRIHLPDDDLSDSYVKVDTQLNPESRTHGESLGSSVCTLDIPPATGTLIADTSLPTSISPSSSQISLSPTIPLIDSPPAQARLRPTLASSSYADNRLSVDLHSSFQMHTGAPDATFDLLNEKISFFNTKDGMDSFLQGLDIDTSFGEDDFGSVEPDAVKKTLGVNPGKESPASFKRMPPIVEAKPVGSCMTRNDDSLPPLPPPEANRINISDFPSKSVPTVFTTEDGSAPTQKGPSNSPRVFHTAASAVITGQRTKTSGYGSPRSSFDANNSNGLSTPSSSRTTLSNPPPPPVPGLRIIKRAKVLTRRLSTATNAPTTSTLSSRRTSSVPIEIIPTARPGSIHTMSSSPVTDPIQTLPAKAVKKTAAPAFPTVPLSGDGPRRVLISEGPKLSSMTNSRAAAYLDQAKASSATGGPRRIAVAPPANIVEKPAVQASTGLRQPAKYANLGPSTAIPKPVSRIPGSRLPAPPSTTNIKARFGAPTSTVGAPGKGLLGRRAT